MHIYMHLAGKGRGLLCIYIYAFRAERVKDVGPNVHITFLLFQWSVWTLNVSLVLHVSIFGL